MKSRPAVLLISLLFVSAGMIASVYGQDEADYMIRVQGWLFKSSDDLFQYDDGTPQWITNAGRYRGVCFETEDFYGAPATPDISFIEFWFYHHPTVPWETDEFYAELWNGWTYWPYELLDRSSASALHYSSLYVEYSPYIEVGSVFWAIVNTSFSSNGTPTTLTDDSPNWTGSPHSYFSNDFQTWEIYTPGSTSLTSASWGWIKGLYR